MFPTEISEESPLKQSILHRHYNPATEDRTQEQIEIYFAECHDVSICSRGPARHVTVYWNCADHLPARSAPHWAAADGPGRQPRPLPVPAAGQAGQDLPGDCQVISCIVDLCHDVGCCSTWTQTSLSFPPVLPAAVELLLRQHCQAWEQQQQPVLEHENSNLSNSTLRHEAQKLPSPPRPSVCMICDDVSQAKVVPGRAAQQQQLPLPLPAPQPALQPALQRGHPGQADHHPAHRSLQQSGNNSLNECLK